MSEIMRPMPFPMLMEWALAEYQNEGRVFGIQKDKFYHNRSGTGIEMFGQQLSSPVGPAAGPHSQLAQNIVAAYLAGSRFIELKTVQKMDGEELRSCIARPCIRAEDEGYNVEWSTELTVPQAFEEYTKAWVAIHVLCKEFGVSNVPGCIFNMSVGYDLEGIQTPKIDSYIEGMKDAAQTPVYQDAVTWLGQNLAQFEKVTIEDIQAIPACISNSVTLSTLHGCPPDEIERIANYLLEHKQVHTFVKCNPTLLGYQTARRLLDEMGYDYIHFDGHHFDDDLQFPDAVAMLARLLEKAAGQNLAFGVKITNTFPVQITRNELPGDEMYMSGRALFPLSLQVANKLAQQFGAQLPISYSGGADAYNIKELFEAGIRPITVATTLLKPGGYERLKQLAEILEPAMETAPEAVNAEALAQLAGSVTEKAFYHKEQRPVASRKTKDPLDLFDCFMAPCQNGGCPIEQQIPAYLKLVEEGNYEEAFRVIAVDNAAPSVTGAICNHACQGKCTRLDYEEPLHIRNAKWLAAEAAQQKYIEQLTAPPLQTDKTVAVVGAGPAGISAALFLRRAGVAVTVFEKRDKPFGIVEYVIPAFRIPQEALQRDFEMAKKMGIEFRFGVQNIDVSQLQQQHDFVVLAIGAWKECAPAVQEGQQHILDALRFLEESKQNNCHVALGRRVAVIGGGDVAMDCARAAMRAPGTEEVTIMYRRTRSFMPATPEEITEALNDGVKMVELKAPLRYDGQTLCCEDMVLGDWDASGRRGIVGTGNEQHFAFDSVICAVGARIDTSLFEAAGIELDKWSQPLVNEAGESNLAGVYIAGDCKTGPATVVGAIADAKASVIDICRKLGLADGFTHKPEPATVPLPALYARKGVLEMGDNTAADGQRCLGCNTLCEVCCDVCPNRANVRIQVAGFDDTAQILHLDGLCNECGNCGVFCPHTGDPYRDKLTLFWSEGDFQHSKNRGFLRTGNGQYLIRLEDGTVTQCALHSETMPKPYAAVIEATEAQYPYYFQPAAASSSL